MLRCAIFDMDGVIVNTEPLYVEEGRKIFNKFNLDISEKEHYSYCGGSMGNMWSSIRKNHDFNELSVEELCNIFLKQIKDRIINEKNLKISTDLIDLLKDLRKNKVKTALASSSSMDVIRMILNKFKLEKLFDYVISGEMIEKSKPEPDIFLNVIKVLKVRDKEALVFEDSSNGIIASKKANIKVIGYKKYTLNAKGMDLADWVIDDFSQVSFKKLNYFIKLN
ncbi:HAD family hydrolase [Maledivibacter halophilus]|uniref:Haloacid dehalogenase superfamily, subfamily IA, variant 3 with third motif having DD or ED n=1 Tax=Maledivibacter halophilus TaxID=36842 RepID=A0A1T5I992_9FIRM|nr:HAD family phosphatase [Maledivibacter halophilus]SKC35745.1 haloacid dehalogenase superfamily, subfamily IA, variant 3 with third motif having DD or ED [Maledivibacter halophilus]